LDRARLDNDYPFFAGQILRIRTKNGTIAPLVFNRAQEYIHEELETQLASLGRVRALMALVANRHFGFAEKDREFWIGHSEGPDQIVRAFGCCLCRRELTSPTAAARFRISSVANWCIDIRARSYD
jgi:hypothetical protein